MTTLPAIDAYRRIAAVYDGAVNPVTALERRTLAPLLPDMTGLRVLDAGSGTGYWADYCRHRGAWAIALDACEQMLLRAAPPRVVARAETLPVPDAAADLVICGMMLAYAPAAFAELVRVLRPGGGLFVSDLHPQAVARGWSRGFRVSGEIVEPTHRPYALADLSHPALNPVQLVEAAFGGPEAMLFEQAGRQAAFDSMTAHPAIFVAHWRKQC